MAVKTVALVALAAVGTLVALGLIANPIGAIALGAIGGVFLTALIVNVAMKCLSKQSRPEDVLAAELRKEIIAHSNKYGDRISDAGKIGKVTADSNVITFQPEKKALETTEEKDLETVELTCNDTTYKIPVQFQRDFIERTTKANVKLGSDKFSISDAESAKQFVVTAKQFVEDNFECDTAKKQEILNCILMNITQTSMVPFIAMLTEGVSPLALFKGSWPADPPEFPKAHGYMEKSKAGEHEGNFRFEIKDGKLECQIKFKQIYFEKETETRLFKWDASGTFVYSDFGSRAEDGSMYHWKAQCVHRDPATLTVINP
jgi:hypothetical protein